MGKSKKNNYSNAGVFPHYSKVVCVVVTSVDRNKDGHVSRSWNTPVFCSQRVPTRLQFRVPGSASLFGTASGRLM